MVATTSAVTIINARATVRANARRTDVTRARTREKLARRWRDGTSRAARITIGEDDDDARENASEAREREGGRETMRLTLATVELGLTTRMTTPTQARGRALRRGVVAQSGKEGKDKVYIGKGRFVEDDAKKYAGRDNWFTGGWPGGEKALKEVFIQEELKATKGKQATSDAVSDRELPDYSKGSYKVYVGKGKYVEGDAKQFAGRDNLLTGGWAGGEVNLKVGQALKLKNGDLVKIRAGGGFFGIGSKPERVGTVRKVNTKKNGDATVEVAVLPFDRVETVDASLCSPTTVEEM